MQNLCTRAYAQNANVFYVETIIARLGSPVKTWLTSDFTESSLNGFSQLPISVKCCPYIVIASGTRLEIYCVTVRYVLQT